LWCLLWRSPGAVMRNLVLAAGAFAGLMATCVLGGYVGIRLVVKGRL
jgi:hypothetical protein